MIKENINYISRILDKKEKLLIVAYFFFSLIVGFLETIGIGIIPGFFSILIDKNILINKVDFNLDLQNLLIIFFNSENFFFYLCFGIIVFFLIKSLIVFFLIFLMQNYLEI